MRLITFRSPKGPHFGGGFVPENSFTQVSGVNLFSMLHVSHALRKKIAAVVKLDKQIEE